MKMIQTHLIERRRRKCDWTYIEYTYDDYTCPYDWTEYNEMDYT